MIGERKKYNSQCLRTLDQGSCPIERFASYIVHMLRATRRRVGALVTLVLLGGSFPLTEHGPVSGCAASRDAPHHAHGLASEVAQGANAVGAPQARCPHCTMCEFVTPCSGTAVIAVTECAGRSSLPITDTHAPYTSDLVAGDRRPPPGPPPKPRV